MPIEGAIYLTGTGAAFTRDAWCQLVADRREFRRAPLPQRNGR
jgi:hypothetical protein